jgi:hypothetical protein
LKRRAEGADENAGNSSGAGPIHRVDIEAAEVVPSHSGRAARGFVARVHRHPLAGRGVIPSSPQPARRAVGVEDGFAGNLPSATAPETHVFSDHRDLVNFLADALAQDAAKRA